MTTEKIDQRARATELVEAGIRAGTPGAEELGTWLANVRAERGQSRAEVAKKVGVSETVYGSWETGRGVPGRRSMIGLRRWLGKEGSNAMTRMVARIGLRTRAVKATEARKAVGLPDRPDLGPDGVSVQPEPERAKKQMPRTPSEYGAMVERRTKDADEALLVALIESSLSARHKALLSAAVVSALAGIEVEIEIRTRV